MHHAYKDGFSVLPRLKRLAGGSPFHYVEHDHSELLDGKRDITRIRTCFFERDITEEIYADVCRFLVENYPIPLETPHTFENLAMQIQEDMAIVRASGDRDWIAAVHACFPSGWRPEEKVGLAFAATHAVVPGMKLSNGAQMVETMIRSGPFERHAWGLTFEPSLDGHPDRPRAEFDPANPRVFVKVERQVTVGFPEHNAALFLIRPHLFRAEEIDRQALCDGLRQMSPEQRRYKGIGECFDDLIAYLASNRTCF